MFTVVAAHLYRADLHRQPVAGAARPLGLPGQGQGVLMLDRLIHELPRFFNYSTMLFLLPRPWARRWLLTSDRLRRSASCWASRSCCCAGRRAVWASAAPDGDRSMSSSSGASRSWSSSISSCSSSRPSLRTLRCSPSPWSASADLAIAYHRRDHPRRLRIGAAPADRGRHRHEFQPLAALRRVDRAAVLAGDPAAGLRLHGGLHQGHRPGLPDRRLRAHLRRQGAEQSRASPRSWSSAPSSCSISPCPIP